MKMIEMIPTQVEQIKSVTCNCCGEDIGDALNWDNYISFSYTGGYGSKIGDGFGLEFDLCETCLDKFIKTFKIAPKEGYRY